jgi:hypothetical protein
MGNISPPRIDNQSVGIVLTGGVDQITTDDTLWSDSASIVAHPSNTGVIEIFEGIDTTTAPAGGSFAKEVSHLSLAPGGSVPLPLKLIQTDVMDNAFAGFQAQLARYWAMGNAGDVIKIVFPVLK